MNVVDIDYDNHGRYGYSTKHVYQCPILAAGLFLVLRCATIQILMHDGLMIMKP